MTRVRRRSPVVEAVQWHKPGDEPVEVHHDTTFMDVFYRALRPGDWIVSMGQGMYCRAPAARMWEEYERVDERPD